MQKNCMNRQTDRQTDTVQYIGPGQTTTHMHTHVQTYRHMYRRTDAYTGNMPIPVMYTYSPGLHAWAVSYRVCYIIRLVNIESE